MSTKFMEVERVQGKPDINQQKKKSKDSITEGVKNIFRLKKKNEAIKARIFRDIKNLFE